MGLRLPRSLGTRCAAAALVAATAGGCSSDFSTDRQTAPRGSLGQELFIGLCDRVAAQAVPEDVTGWSWHAVCHPDSSGHFATQVDVSRLPPLDPAAVNAGGAPVPLAQQEADRVVNVARIEALARDRTRVTSALDAAMPDVALPVKNLGSPDPARSCDPAGTGRLHDELASVLGRLVSLEDDGTLPLFTEALARVMDGVKASPDTQAALARLDARQGYRPLGIALGVGEPVLTYPRLVPMVQSLLTLLATDSAPYDPAGVIDPGKPLGPGNRKPIAGKDAALMQQLLAVGRDELRASTVPAPLGLLSVTSDPTIPARQLLSRPRTTTELTRQVLLQSGAAFDVHLPTPALVVQRDPRSYAAVPAVHGAVPAPFVDHDGDGLPDVDALGQFVTQDGKPAVSPFFSPDGTDGPRDAQGRATGQAAPTLYGYLDAGQTFMASLEADLAALLDPDPTHGHEAVLNLLGGSYVLFGSRDNGPLTTRQYPPDPESAAPTQPTLLGYSAFHPESSPLEDLTYALGVMLSDPVMDDLDQLARQLMAQHPQTFARLVGLGLNVKAIADAHPEAHLPATSTLWDEMLDDLALIAHVQDGVGAGGVLEDLILSFADDRTPRLQQAFAAYVGHCDSLTYDPGSTSCATYTDPSTCRLNGPPWNASSKDDEALHVACNPALPDVGTNRSALQMFMQTLHDARGMSACTKAGAVAHVTFNLGALGVQTFDYPTNALSAAACTLVGAPAPRNPMPQCGILRIPDVDALLLDVVLGRAKFDIRDPCLAALVSSPITNIVGGADAFLQQQSGIIGFDTKPTVPGVSRFFYFDAPAYGMAGDPNPATLATGKFISGLIDPAPTSACVSTPFTDTDGLKLSLFDCTPTPQYDLRHRDPGATFPLELYGFAPNVQPLAAAFDDHGQSALFVDLFNTLHLHWGSSRQTPDICDPSLPRTADRWCSQDGAVTYEPLLSDVLTHVDVLQTLHDAVPVLAQTLVTHCDAQNPATHACVKTSTRTGVQVLASAVRVMVDPAQNVGLTDRKGVKTAPRNDGTTNPQVTPIYLVLDALDGIDAAFTAWAKAHPGDDRHPAWLAARSQVVDQFFSVTGTGASTAWANGAIPAIGPALLDALESQILAQCPDRSSRAACSYWSKQMPQNLADVVGGPTFAAVMDLLDALRSDDVARAEVEKLLVYLLGPGSAAARSSTLAASVDLLQVLSDDANLSPLYNGAADVLGAQTLDAQGHVTRRGLADAAINVLAHVFAVARDPGGAEVCSQEVDPNGAIASVLATLATPMSATEPAPIEALMDVTADVNRADPASTAKLAAPDYANIASEVSEFCLDPASGLEQVYAVVREATMPGGVLAE